LLADWQARAYDMVYPGHSRGLAMNRAADYSGRLWRWTCVSLSQHLGEWCSHSITVILREHSAWSESLLVTPPHHSLRCSDHASFVSRDEHSIRSNPRTTKNVRLCSLHLAESEFNSIRYNTPYSALITANSQVLGRLATRLVYITSLKHD